mmetsp:Transcript_12957/g.16813  ORF Transcript_12957/g.16813 Transcript_12957/m.16813 type:complete len:363 (+) Transcript_12957:263-1351(+)
MVEVPAAPSTSEGGEESTKDRSENPPESENPLEIPPEEEKEFFFAGEVHHSEEEVVDRLFNVEHLNKDLSSIWGWASSAAESISETVKKSTEELKEKVETVSKDLDLDSALKQVSETVLEATDSIKMNMDALNKAEKEDEATKEDLKSVQKHLQYPWEPKTRFSSEIRERVMRLSEDNNTFLVPPPEQVNFKLDLTEKIADGAKLMLEVDKNLSKKRFELVPRQVDEDTFFRNYFYRVELIKRSYGVNESIDQQYSKSAPVDITKASNDLAGTDGDDFESKGVATKREESNSMSWEEELSAELADETNFDMFDDDELLAAVDAEGSVDVDVDVDVDDDFADEDADDLGLEERIKAELNLSDS